MARMLLAFILLWTVGSVKAQSNFDRFQLFKECEPMMLFAYVQQSDGDELDGLTEASVRNAVESRLRSARLYADEGVSSTLTVFVQIAGSAFHLSLSFRKIFFDIASGESGLASTWSVSSTGTHGTGSDYVLSALSQHMDEFLVEYLRINEEACERQ